MQDSLKTRLWDAEEKTMHYTDFVITSTGYVAKLQPMYELEEDENGDEIEIQSEKEFMIDQTDLDFDKKMIVLKCTGLKDRNSKLIYAGDIVREYFGETGTYTVEYFPYTASFQYFNLNDEAPNWEMLAEQFEGMSENQGISTDLEIIGNIYENPELLEGGCDV